MAPEERIDEDDEERIDDEDDDRMAEDEERVDVAGCVRTEVPLTELLTDEREEVAELPTDVREEVP